MKIITESILILGLLLVFGCGFKVADKSNTNNFKIKEINTAGNNRINYKIKNYLSINTSQDNNNSPLSINIQTKEIKEIKEKNIKNEITKYKITLNANVDIYFIEENKQINSNLSVSGDYLVHSNYSTTISNEKKLINRKKEFYQSRQPENTIIGIGNDLVHNFFKKDKITDPIKINLLNKIGKYELVKKIHAQYLIEVFFYSLLNCIV